MFVVRPTVVHAIQFTGTNYASCRKFVLNRACKAQHTMIVFANKINITVHVGDWIIRKGGEDFRVCSNECMHDLYVQVNALIANKFGELMDSVEQLMEATKKEG